jgi:hypothetical protein
MAPPSAPGRPPRLGGRPLAIGGVLLAIVLIGLGLALIPRGAKQPAPGSAARAATTTPTATATPPPSRGPSLAKQVQTLDALMRMSERGRAAAVKGNFAAAAANRARLARRIGRLRSSATSPALRAGLTRLNAAVDEALRQNRSCKANCSTEDLQRIGRLKQAALDRLNPLLRRYAHTSYRRAQI